AAGAAALLGAAAGADTVQDFLRSHWRLPLAPQGQPPVRYSPLEASLSPGACGSCHPAQYADWRESTHAAAMGPGIAGQLAQMPQSDPHSARAWRVCQGPRAEQAPLTVGDGGPRPNPAYDAALRGKGVRPRPATCAVTSGLARRAATAPWRAQRRARLCPT